MAVPGASASVGQNGVVLLGPVLSEVFVGVLATIVVSRCQALEISPGQRPSAKLGAPISNVRICERVDSQVDDIAVGSRMCLHVITVTPVPLASSGGFVDPNQPVSVESAPCGFAYLSVEVASSSSSSSLAPGVSSFLISVTNSVAVSFLRFRVVVGSGEIAPILSTFPLSLAENYDSTTGGKRGGKLERRGY